MTSQVPSPFRLRTRPGLARVPPITVPASAPPAVADDDAEDPLRLVKRSRVVDLSHPWKTQSPRNVNGGTGSALRAFALVPERGRHDADD